YHLSLKMFSVGSRSLKNIELINTAMPFTAQLRNTFGEAVHMGILDGNTAVYVIKEESKHNLRMFSRVGKAIPLYCTAIGKVFLSSMTEEELEAYFSSCTMVPLTVNSIRTREEMMKELELVRKQGYAVDNEENEMNIFCIGVPVRNYTGSVIAAISVSWPLFRLDKARVPELAEEVKKKAEELSRVLGYLD
ncbi:MAG: IclR family transcriptional regulator, partial [Spirochaetales bacterium]|nr:IclR family transcriptional regulator [Candidatus Physcosoma equi]